MFETTNAAGYDLIWEETNKWFFVVNGDTAFVGSFREAIALMVKRGFLFDEIEFALDEMLKNGHSVAHFGMYKSFIFTFNKEERKSA